MNRFIWVKQSIFFLLSLLFRIGFPRFNRRPVLRVLAFHKVGICPPHFREKGVWLDTFFFEKCLDYLKSPRFRVLSIREFQAFLQNPQDFDPKIIHILITFDDGHRSVKDIAMPILEKKGFPAICFFSTDFLMGTGIAWWDILATYDDEALDRFQATLLPIHLPYNQLVDEVKQSPEIEKEVRRRFKDSSSSSEYLSMDEIRMFPIKSMAIGFHAATHRRLAGLSQKELTNELAMVQSLEAALGQRVDCIAYPFGQKSDYSSNVIDGLKETKLRYAFTTVHEDVTPTSLHYKLGRYVVSDYDTFPTFVLKVHGVWQFLYRKLKA